MDDLSVGVDKELGKVPRDQLGLFLFGIPSLRALGSEESVNGMCVLSIDVNLREHGELSVIFPLGEGLDLGLCARLLVPELVTGERKDLESLRFVLLMDLHHFFVVQVGETSLSGHVDHHGALLTTTEVFEGHLVSVYGLRSEL